MTEIIENNSKRRIKTGVIGERVVSRILLRLGYAPIAKNMALYKGKKLGEIDMLVAKNDVLYIVEVRSGGNAWDREDRLPERKRRVLTNILKELYSLRSGLRDGFMDAGACLTISRSADVVMLKAALIRAKRIRMIVAEVRLLPDFSSLSASNRCDVEFSPIHPYS